MGWDGFLKHKMIWAIKRELEKTDELADEVWLTEKQLIEEMPFFKKSWLKHKGYKLHPRCVIVKNKNGEVIGHSKKFYPRNNILKRLRESKITDNELGGCIYKYRMNGGVVEVGGFDIFSNKWKDGLSIDEIVCHL